MDEQKNMGFSIELDNGRCNIWMYGDGDTLVNLAIAALANIVAETSSAKEDATHTMLDVQVALLPALDAAWKDKDATRRDAGDSAASDAAQDVMQEA